MSKHARSLVPRANSSVVIARLLHSEGWTEHVAATCRSYWRRVVANQSDKAQRRIEHIEQAFRETVTASMTATQKQILGKFISLREKAAFDTGFIVGFMTSLYPEELPSAAVKIAEKNGYLKGLKKTWYLSQDLRLTPLQISTKIRDAIDEAEHEQEVSQPPAHTGN